MIKKFPISVVLFLSWFSQAQEVALPADFRQHNLAEFNSSLMNPVFSLTRNNPGSIAFWSKYQWQHIDSSPSSWMLNYTGKINDRSSMGVGIMQHNTGVLHYTGGVVNYAHAFNLGASTRLSFGLNVFGFKSELAEDRYGPDYPVLLPQLEGSDAFILQFAPGVRLEMGGLGIGFSSDNLFHYNFKTNKNNSDAEERTYMGTLDYEFPLHIFNGSGNEYFRPMVYVRSGPYEDTQLGLNAVLSSSKFWVQGGYNSFYGISGGVGGRFFKRISLGALVEFGLDGAVKQKDPSFEIVAAYSFGNKNDQVNTELEDELVISESSKKENGQAEKQDEMAIKEHETAQKEALALERQRTETLRLKLQQKTDSLTAALAAAEQRVQEKDVKTLTFGDKIRADKERIAERKSAGLAVTNGHYVEVDKLEGEKAGFYLIANVYATQKYRDIFLQILRKKGIGASFFFVPRQKYDYVYLERYDTLSEAEVARDSRFFGKYSDRIWIYRIIGED